MLQRKQRNFSSSTRSITSIVDKSNDTPKTRIENARKLYELFLKQAPSLFSDWIVIEHGTIKVVTTSGDTLTIKSVLHALQERDRRHVAQRKRRAIVQSQREERAAQKLIAQTKAQELRR